MPGKVSDMAKALSALLAEQGPIQTEQVRQWLKENEDPETPLSPRDINNILAYGRAKGRGWWQREGTILLPPLQGNQPGGNGHHQEPATDPEGEDSDPAATPSRRLIDGLIAGEDLLSATAQRIGVPRERARPAAAYLAATYDIYDPAQLWKGLGNCTEIPPAMRKRWWETWLSQTGINAPEELHREVQRTATEHFGPRLAAKPEPPRRRYVVVDGDPIPTDADDPDGMPMSEAWRLALLQRQGKGITEAADKSALVELVKQQGEFTRSFMEIQARNQDKPESGNRRNRYLAVDGQVVVTDPQDPDGLPFTEATSLAALHRQQRRESSDHAQEDSLLETVFKEGQATQREMMKMQGGSRSDLSGILEAQRGEAQARMDAMMERLAAMDREHEVRLQMMQKEGANHLELLLKQQELQQKQWELQLDLVKQQHSHELEMLQLRLDQEAPDPWGAADQALPGIKKHIGDIIGRAFSPPQSQPQYVIKLGENNEVPFEVFEKMENLQLKRRFVDQAMSIIPDFVAAGRMAAEQTRDDAPLPAASSPPAAPRQAVPAATPPPAPSAPAGPNRVQASCTQCGMAVNLEPGTRAFRCPNCQTMQQAATQGAESRIYHTLCSQCQAAVGYQAGSEGFICPVCGARQWITGELIPDQEPSSAATPPMPPGRSSPPRPVTAAPAQPQDSTPGPGATEDSDQIPGLEYAPYTGGPGTPVPLTVVEAGNKP